MVAGRAENTRGMHGTFISVSDLPAIDWPNRTRMFNDNNPSADRATQFMHGTMINFDNLSPPCRNNYVHDRCDLRGEGRLISQTPFHFLHNAKQESQSVLSVGRHGLDCGNLYVLPFLSRMLDSCLNTLFCGAVLLRNTIILQTRKDSANLTFFLVYKYLVKDTDFYSDPLTLCACFFYLYSTLEVSQRIALELLIIRRIVFIIFSETWHTTYISIILPNHCISFVLTVPSIE